MAVHVRLDTSGRVSSSDKDKCCEGNKTGAHDGERLAQATLYQKLNEGLSEEETGKPRSE